MTALLDTVPVPPRIARLPHNAVGYPIPWFVATLEDGARDFRIASQERYWDAIRFKLCWICGQPAGRFVAFTVGPMCAVNRISGEPPGHRDCAVYAARVCPFLANPNMHRRESGRPAEMIPAAGEMITRNPGVALVWVTRKYSPYRAPAGNSGLLCEIGDPEEVQWFAEGRPATRDEVAASMESGLPALREAAERDPNPDKAHRLLDDAYRVALDLLPA